jgi:hypothetical protein
MRADPTMNNAHDVPAAPSSPADAWLDDLLVADGTAQRAAYIDDAGFTTRVVEALPRPAPVPAWRRPVVAALWGTAAIALVLAMPSLFVDLLREAHRLLSAQPFSLAGVGIALSTLVVLTWGAAAWSLGEHD